MQRKIAPGVCLAVAVALAASLLAGWEGAQRLGLSALTLAILGGMVVGNTVYRPLAAACDAGLAFSKQRLLRLGIVLFGFKLTFHDIAAVGWAGLLIDALVLSSTFGLAYWVGRRRLGLDEQSVILIGAGSSICGAAAVLATEPVVKARAEAVAVAVATVVVFGTAAMFLWPAAYGLARGWGITEHQFGLFAGSTLHEVAQAAVAGRAVSNAAMDAAVITKMLRVMMLVPFLMALSAWLARRAGRARPAAAPGTAVQVPWFAVAFLALAVCNTYVPLPPAWVQGLIGLDNLLLATAMAALGLTTRLGAIRQAGVRPLLLALVLCAWLFVGGGAINAGVTLLWGGLA